ncbi:protein of unknown function [Pedobacter steynii]|uniref:DUF4133 domain-containing protein n=1 Tax=Pedobacter steynii TaxID=430522 RepID=A0A1G9K4H9_9SPHI|nr:DUF4133 domain-containing protein [Pedobacter steynii]NQX38446.1 DUF4133 domain-containing protein [Pedobacter steynii]SDL44658.1 protein of unknown function [Pedobacter steynii]
MSSIYQINKGVSKPIVFKGLKAQYIAYLAIGLVLLLLVFVMGYILGMALYLLLVLVLGLGALLFYGVFRLSFRFGEHGLMKFFARRGLPKVVVFRSRHLFTGLKSGPDGLPLLFLVLTVFGYGGF